MENVIDYLIDKIFILRIKNQKLKNTVMELRKIGNKLLEENKELNFKNLDLALQLDRIIREIK